MTQPHTPFQRHLLFFAQPQPPCNITILSALRASLRLGLNFPVSLALSLGLRLLYAPFPHYFRPVPVLSISPSQSRTQLESAKLSQADYTNADLVKLYLADPRASSRSWLAWSLDLGHIISFWSMAADVKSGKVSVDDVKRFQTGDWEEAIAKRRKSRLPGRGDVLPFWRGGPTLVAPHSWAVGRLLGVDVYEPL